MVFWLVEVVDEGLEVREGSGVDLAIFGGKALLAVRFDVIEDYGWGMLVLPRVRTHGGR